MADPRVPVVILCGGAGTRLSEQTEIRPKPLVEIGGRPILWHIMKHYSRYGFSEFVLALGYKGDQIKRYFLGYHAVWQDITVNLGDGSVSSLNKNQEPWTVHLVDTGESTLTGGRLRQLEPLIGGGTFMLTYGDGLSDVDIRALVEFHGSHGRLATVTATHPPARFGAIELDGDRVAKFSEKSESSVDWINGGFFVFEPKVLEYLDSDTTILERDPLERLAAESQLMAFRHSGFWQPMDTLREKELLESLWSKGEAPWRMRA